MFTHQLHSHFHTPQVSHLIINSFSLCFQPTPNQSFAFGKEMGPAAPAVLCFRLINPLFAPGGSDRWGGSVCFWVPGHFKNFLFSRDSWLTFSIVSVLIISTGRVAPSFCLLIKIF
nr:MAG TPA: hypothetical protein [Bacteriophage sp.]